jgi:dephospho-CoA kinase
MLKHIRGAFFQIMTDDKNSRFLKAGLTGSLGSGKSEVRKIFADLGVYTIDADLISRELSEPGEAAYEKIVESWGKAVLNKDGSLNRKALADTVFVNPEDTDKLNEMFHPLIIEQENDLASDFMKKNDHGIIVTEAALMIEAGSWRRFDRVILVSCPDAVRRRRLKESRGMDKDIFDLISKRQMPDDEKRKLADYVIENSGTLGDLKVQTEQIYYKLYDELIAKMKLG